MNKQQLASKIWALANELRGKVAAATYKDYMLGFLFYKYLSDKEEQYLINKLDYDFESLAEVNEEDTQPKKNCMDNLGYFIAHKNLFSTWISLEKDFSIGNVTVSLSAFDRHISPAYKKVFTDIFSTLSTRITDLGSTDPDRTKNAAAIIKLVKSIPTTNNNEYDILGFIYEYLLKNFAANAGKAGEFYTPHEASTVMSEIIAYYSKDKETLSIYDPTSGSGSLLLNIGTAVSSYLGDKNKIKYYAQEWIADTYNLTRMNLIMHDILPGNIVARHADTLETDWPYFDNDPEEYEYLSVDACCSNPPYSQTWDPKPDARFDDYGLAPKSKADYAFLLHNLYHLNPSGIMTIVLPHGVLFRGGEEGTIREQLVRKGKIETIIGLPANLFYGTGIPTIIMVLRKNREEKDILFVDASKGFVKEGNKNKLRSRDVRKIVDTVIERKKKTDISKLVTFEEIERNGFNLNIPRYVDTSDKDDIHDIYALMFGGIPNKEIYDGKYKEFWAKFPSLKEDLFASIDDNYSRISVDSIKKITENNKEVKSFILNHTTKFSYLKNYLCDELLHRTDYHHLDAIEMNVANTIKSRLSEDDLIDYYDCFEVIDNVWNTVFPDLEIVSEQDFDAAREIDEVIVLKKDSKTQKLEEKIIGNEGRLIPFSMIQTEYFADKAASVSLLSAEVSRLSSEKDSLLDSIEEEDKVELLKTDDSGDIDTKKLKEVISKIKKKLKNGAEYEEDSYESIIINIDSVNSQISNTKKKLKTAQQELNTLTEEKIRGLSDIEIYDLLVKKWIDPICDGINNLSYRLISDFEREMNRLVEKYETTFVDTNTQIDTISESLASMIGDLVGNSYDMQGLLQLKELLGGTEE